MLHLSLMTTCVILHTFDYGKFFDIKNSEQCTLDMAKPGSKARNFMETQKFWLTGQISGAHLLCVVLHYMSELLHSQGHKGFAKIFMLAKVFIYVVTILVVQSGIVFSDCRIGIINQSQVMAWLNYEIMAFYFNIIAMGVFLLLSSCKKFRSIRDRVGLGIGQRKTFDYLNYCKDDIHWFCMWFTSFSLCIFSIIMRNKDHEGIQISAGVKFTRHFLEVVLLR